MADEHPLQVFRSVASDLLPASRVHLRGEVGRHGCDEAGSCPLPRIERNRNPRPHSQGERDEDDECRQNTSGDVLTVKMDYVAGSDKAAAGIQLRPEGELLIRGSDC